MRFEKKNDDSAVLDRETGLMWCRDGGVSEFPLGWEEVFDFIRSLNSDGYGGHSDWRLPNRRELLSLISFDEINPALPKGHPFENVFPGYYWTSTTCSRLPTQAWYIHLGGAKVYRGMKYASYMVWPVRSGEDTTRVYSTGQKDCYDVEGRVVSCGGTFQDGEIGSGIRWPEPRFDDAGGVVIDRLTGLIWTRDADLAEGLISWEEARELVRRMNGQKAFGYSDWRLPEIREFETLIDLGRHSPALPGGFPFVNVRDFYWSASTSMYEPRYAWAMYMVDGALGVGFKAGAGFGVWGVRGAIR